jgi:hypothetical protein
LIAPAGRELRARRYGGAVLILAIAASAEDVFAKAASPVYRVDQIALRNGQQKGPP